MWFQFLGPRSSVAALKKADHNCELLIGNDAGKFLHLLIDSKSVVIAFSVMTGMHAWVVQTAARLKKKLACLIVLRRHNHTFFAEVIKNTLVPCWSTLTGIGLLIFEGK